MYVSIAIRFEANVEALNMSESVGQYSKHRKVPYLIMRDNKVDRVYVPAISGEILAHMYQEFLVSEAKSLYPRHSKNIPVCEECARGDFFKSMNIKYLEKKVPNLSTLLKDKKNILNTKIQIEKKVIESCLVEDIGGFLVAEKVPLRRTSAFQVSYALPTKDFVLLATIEPQLHARHSTIAGGEKEEGKKEAKEQMIYYIEAGTAIYGFTINIDLSSIGISSLTGKPILNDNEIKLRRRIALLALLRMISSQYFGAKLSRFFPVGSIISVVATVTEKPFTVTSPIYPDFAKTTSKRLKSLQELGEDGRMFVFGVNVSSNIAVVTNTPEDAIVSIIKYLEEKKII